MEEEIKEVVDVREITYDVKKEEFIADYKKTLAEKDEKKILALEKLNERVAARIEELRPEIELKIVEEINKELECEYKEKIELYEKYLVEKKVLPCGCVDICTCEASAETIETEVAREPIVETPIM